MHRQALLLATAQALVQTASILVMTVGRLARSRMAPARAGRRMGFITGALLGALGGLVAACGIVLRSLWLLSFCWQRTRPLV
jgi:hypothetical protein